MTVTITTQANFQTHLNRTNEMSLLGRANETEMSVFLFLLNSLLL